MEIMVILQTDVSQLLGHVFCKSFTFSHISILKKGGTADSISFVKAADTIETPPIITEIARPEINNVVVNYVVEIYAPSITNISKVSRNHCNFSTEKF